MIARDSLTDRKLVDVIAKSKSRTKGLLLLGRRAAVCLVGLSLAGCTSSLDLFGSAEKIDRNISTGTVPGAPQHTGATLSDETTVRNAVTSADLERLGNASLPWANTATGSAGVVSQIREARNEGHICRDFMTTRHSYEGIAMFSGQACLTNSGDWMLTAFDRQ
ncbi:outer membrane surface antigen [Xaviernesmea oryzae]|uniref:Outer membrane surface antigen n=1 Tax=Xaviernesmea oryzae TaxID=464029 RepID=A0A1X7F5D0_9HYPH|nr:outer membrane surface antigen [Xaviernesmea oryzae]